MKRKALNISFFLIILFGIVVFIIELYGKFIGKDKTDSSVSDIHEYFDPSLSRLRSVSEFASYCDSINGGKVITKSDSEKYVTIISRTLRNRFYHGYSYYSLGQNTFGYILAPLIEKGLSAIVIPDDILKYPMAACSQQSIIGMEVFKRKGFKVRKVGFYSDSYYGGHFCYESFYNGKWHFFDPDKEPKLSIMIDNHFPSIAEIVKNNSLLHSLYYKESYDYVEKLFPTYQYGPVNKFPAPHAIIYQYATKYLSYFSWLIFLLIYLFVNRQLTHLKKRKSAGAQNSIVTEQRA